MEHQRLAAFDLDGTLTWADTLVAFLRWRSGRWASWGRMARLAPAGVGYALRRIDRARLKEAVLTRFVGGAGVDEVAEDAREFAGARADWLLRADGVAALDDHRTRGDRVVIVTACPELVAQPLGERLGAEVIGTRLEVVDGVLTGRLDGANCRGPEKIARLKAALPSMTVTYAYGDSHGDDALLAAAGLGRYRVFRDGPRLGSLRAYL